MNKEIIEKFKKEISEVENPEEIKAVCEKYGIDKLSEEEMNKVILGEKNNGELSDEELDNVSGGLRDRWGRLMVDASYTCDNFEYGGNVAEDIVGIKTLKNCGKCKYAKWTGFFTLYICHR